MTGGCLALAAYSIFISARFHRKQIMSANTFHIAVLPGDGIGHEVMAPTLEILNRIEATTSSLKFRFSEAQAGAEHYKATGK
jgi:3-isopropylmalate dehydrogenase